jgi:hypothetical protein
MLFDRHPDLEGAELAGQLETVITEPKMTRGKSTCLMSEIFRCE